VLEKVTNGALEPRQLERFAKKSTYPQPLERWPGAAPADHEFGQGPVAKRAEQLEAVHHRHLEVGDEQRDARFGGKLRERSLTVFGFQNGVSLAFQDAAE